MFQLKRYLSIKNLEIPKVVWIIAAFAFMLRIWGIWYGLPLQLNVDEPSFVSGVLGIKYDLNPGRFDWPSLYFYINAGFYFVFSIIKIFISLLTNIPEEAYSSTAYFLISRFLSVTFGTATVLAVYVLGKEVFGSKQVGILSALILSVIPVHVYESHLAKLDVAHAFFIAVAVYWIWQIYKIGDLKSYLWAGVWIGLSTSVKYNSALIFMSVIIAYFLRMSERTETDVLKKYWSIEDIKKAFYAGLISIVTFFIGTPFALIDFDTFFSNERGVGALWQFENVGSVAWSEYPSELYETFSQMFYSDLGLSLWIVFSLMLISFVFFNMRSKGYVFMLLPTVLISLYITRLDRSPSHYFIMLMPYYVPALANFILNINNALRNVGVKVGLGALTAVILSFSLWNSVEADILLSRTDTRYLADKWVKENINESDFVYVIGEELEVVTFKKDETAQIKKLDREVFEDTGRMRDFYLIVGIEGVTAEDLTTGDRDPEFLPGNSKPILENAELLFTTNNNWRYGPPIHIFYVTKVTTELEERAEEEMKKLLEQNQN